MTIRPVRGPEAVASGSAGGTPLPLLVAHFRRALSEHVLWCGVNGYPVPPELAVVTAVLSASSGPERPDLAASSQVIEPVSVGYEEAASALGVSVRTVRRLVAGGRLPVARVGRRRLVAVEDLRALVSAEGVDDRSTAGTEPGMA